MTEIKNLSKIKLFLGIVLIAAAMFIFMPNNVFATTNYEVYVNGEQFTSEKTTINCGDGTATFDISTNTLILNNATITKTYGSQYAVINSEISDLTIQLIGNNVIDGNSGAYDGIGAAGGSNVVITGDGNLTMKDVYYGTYIGYYSVPGGNLKINNTSINIENAQATGIWVNHDLEIINSNVKIDKTGDDPYFGIVSNIGGTITIDGGNLDINTNSHCILLGNGDNSNHNVVIKSGNIKLNSRLNGTYGIKFEPVQNTDTLNGNIKIDGGKLEISAIAGGTNIDDSKITINSKLTFIKGTSLKDNGEILLKEAKNYTITYNCNGGSSIASQTVQENSAIQQPTAPTKDGYAFAGWYSDSGLTQAFNFNTPISTDITLYAKWDVVIAAANATVKIPLAGEHPDFNPVAGDSSRYTVTFEVWYLRESPYPDLTANSVFENGKNYALRIRFTPKEGYQFDSNTVFTVNGIDTLRFGGTGEREYFATAYADTDGHNCEIKPVQKVEPSCTEGGKKAYYKCEGCGKFYEDELGIKEITDLAAWGNIPKNGHTESNWKSDKDNHWKECTVAGCGVIIENSKAAHADADNDGKCDVCEYNVGNSNTPGGDKSDDNPQTGDNSMMWLWIALLFVSGFGVASIAVYGKKRKSVK